MQNLTEVSKNFCTGSSYKGEWNVDMSGYGIYKYPDGTEYRGNFKLGLFHGDGHIITSSKFQLFVNCNMGKIMEVKLAKFPDDLEYQLKDWNYLNTDDRRYAIEIKNDIPPVGESYETFSKPARKIPDDYYDGTDSFYLPELYTICNDETLVPYAIATEFERKFIPKFYRNTENYPIGYNPDIIENDCKLMEAVDDKIKRLDNLCICDDCKCHGDDPLAERAVVKLKDCDLMINTI